MNFKKVEFDTDLEDLEADELRDLVTQFSNAQEANEETFGEVAETVEEFTEYNDDLAGEIVENSSLSEPAAEALSFSDKKNLLQDLREDEEESEEFEEETDEETETEFEDRGQKGETHGDEGTPEFVETAVESISGIQ